MTRTSRSQIYDVPTHVFDSEKQNANQIMLQKFQLCCFTLQNLVPQRRTQRRRTCSAAIIKTKPGHGSWAFPKRFADKIHSVLKSFAELYQSCYPLGGDEVEKHQCWHSCPVRKCKHCSETPMWTLCRLPSTIVSTSTHTPCFLSNITRMNAYVFCALVFKRREQKDACVPVLALETHSCRIQNKVKSTLWCICEQFRQKGRYEESWKLEIIFEKSLGRLQQNTSPGRYMWCFA
jgi:hypothetical protein